MHLIPAPPSRDALVETWLPVVLRWCTCMGGPRVDAEDACHDVLLVALDRLPTLRDPERIGAWMYGITRRVLAKHRRAGWIRRWLPGVTVETSDPGPSPARLAQADEMTRSVQAVIDTLEPELREVLLLCDIEERPDEEVATMVELPVGTVKSRLRRARARFEAQARRMGLHTSLAIAEGA